MIPRLVATGALLLLSLGAATLLARLPGAAALRANADALYLPALFDDLLHGGALSDWALTPGPYVFPDMLLFGVAWAAAAIAGAGWQAAMAVYAVLQPGLLLVLAAGLGRVAGIAAGRTLAIVPAVMGLVIAAACAAAGPAATDLYVYPLLPSFHFGAALVALAGFILLVRDRIGIAGLAVAELLTVAGALSDSFTLLFLAGPAVALLALEAAADPARRIDRIVAAATLAAAGFVVLAVQGWVNPLGTEYRDQLALGPEHGLWRLDQILSQPGAAVGLAFAVAAWLPAAIAGARAIRRLRRAPPDPLDRLAIMVLVGGLLTLILPVATGIVREVGSARYLMPVTVFGPLWMGLRIAQRLRRRGAIAAGAVAGLGAAAGLALPWPALPPPAALACGISGAVLTDYWNAKPLRLFSGGAVAAIPITGAGDPYLWIATRSWWRGAEPRAILFERLDSDAIVTTYGRPDRTEPCGDAQLWYYDDPQRVAAVLASRPEVHLPQ